MGNHLTNSFFRDFGTNLSRYVKRKTRYFNAIPRAEKCIENTIEKPIKAPTYEATMKIVDKLMKEMPDSFDKVKEKDEKLHSNLQNVYVTSIGDNKDSFSKELVDPSVERRLLYAQEHDENEVPIGKYNATKAEHFLCAHETDPKLYSADVLAHVYRIDPKAMKNIVEYVKILTVIMPVKKLEKSFLHEIGQDVMPRDMVEETEDQYLERKTIEARDRFDEFFQKELSEEKRASRKLITEMTALEILRLSPKKLYQENFLSQSKNLPPEKGEDELTKRDLEKLRTVEGDEPSDAPVIKPEDFDFDEIMKNTKTKKITSGEQKADKVEENEDDQNCYENENRESQKS